uniref:Uncharacterized protein n=1 Tax=Caenorhabditis japonica TaxID=281687 RepID=A0A8R1IJV8_CAEJA
MKSKSKSRTRLEHDHNELRVFYKRGDAEQEEEMIRVTSINNHSTSSSTSSKKSRKKSTWKPKHRDELPVETDKLLKRLKTMNCSIREKFGIANHSLLPVSDYVPRKKNSIKKCEIPLAPPKVPNHGAPLQSSESLKTLYSKSLHSISTKSQQTRSSSMSPSMVS